MHMKPEILEGLFWRIDTLQGIVILPEDVLPATSFLREQEGLYVERGDTVDCNIHPKFGEEFSPFLEADAITIELIEGFGARMSADGYIDATDWSFHESREEAQEHLDSEVTA